MERICGALALLLCFVHVWGACPSPSKVAPCACSEDRTGRASTLLCQGPAGRGPVLAAVRHMSQQTAAWRLKLDRLHLDEIPGQELKHVIALWVNQCTLDRFLGSAPASWPSLEEVELDSVTVSANASTLWSSYKGAGGLKSLHASNVHIPVLDRDFGGNVPDKLRFLDLRKTGSIRMESGALQHLKELLYFSLIETSIEEIPRDALALHLPHLHTLILSSNRLSELNAGFFEGMPKLKVLMLGGNRLTTLDFGSHFWSAKGHSKHIIAADNPLICDCNVRWLSREIVLATCTDPATEELRDVSTLEPCA